jgi:hypothetical protein
MQPQPHKLADPSAAPPGEYINADDGSAASQTRPLGPTTARVLLVLWPAFMVAAMLEALVFVAVDPANLHGAGTALQQWSPSAVYTLAFVVFWALSALASATTLWLSKPGPWQAT